MNTMEYKGYVAKIEYDPEIRMFCGTVINATPNTFYGGSIDELEKEFATTMEEYSKFCKEKNIEPKKPYSGKFNLRIAPGLHGQISSTAAIEGKSLNQWIADTLEHALG
ncbi:MAG: type II toxin-antitoxin system HicB family antitoxin [Desulfobacterales bacterium]|nr:type II toxin-antitoxin system HicB family antitoxin [Desulfobacterales bacterium]